MFRFAITISCILITINAVAADSVKSLDVFPDKLTLDSTRRAVRLIVSAETNDGSTIDVTQSAKFTVQGDAAKIRGNQIVASANGTAKVIVELSDRTIEVPVTVKLRQSDPVSLRNEVLPILSRQGCSSGACHGSPKGKGGFRLSLRAFDPSIDELTLRNEYFARRTNVLDPDTSLILRKPLTEVPHAGGQRLKKGSTSHQLLRQWIGEGTKLDGPNTATCQSITIFPPLGRELNQAHPGQHFVVLGKFSDGMLRDVTDLAVFTSSDTGIVDVDESGVARRADQSRGQAAITARYLEHMATSFVVSVPDIEGFQWPNPTEANIVDLHVNRKLKQLQYVPSAKTTDAEFLRRVSLDVTGLLPTPERTRKFLADKSKDKRAKLIDELLETPEHAKFMALKWGDALRIRSAAVSSPGVFKYHRWLVRAFANNLPYDQFAQQLLTASGSTFENPTANYYRTAASTNDCTESTAQVFLGARLECAKCHNHPHERWTQDNYYGLGSFFNRIQRDTTERKDEVFVSVADRGEVTQPRTGRTMKPWLPGTGEVDIADGTDRRTVFAQWLTKADNPYFAHVEVNRLWSFMMGRGIVEPIDDFRESNPPSNAELLSALAADFVKRGFDRRHTLRTILNSETYQRQSKPTPQNESDDRYFSHYTRRLLSAEQLLDAICDITGVEEQFSGLPGGTRATQLPSPDFGKEFLKIFGQPERKSVCRCERSDDMNLSQALQISNGSYVAGKLDNGNNRIRQLLKQKKPLKQIVENCYLAAYSRFPTATEVRTFEEFTKSRGGSLEEQLEDLLWAIINSNEFLVQH
ncbi:MAG: hypothetical protein CMJ78_07680 [Planctomycetaceae bacterium]|nr:hypothetical protein [Planctomycetaceae bacterium]